MSNFKLNFIEPYTTYKNELIQEETVFENPYQKLCYLYLYSYGKCEKIFPSMEKIAAAIICKKKHATKIIKQLEDLGFIEVERHSGKSNNYALNDYFAVAEKIKNEVVSDKHQYKSPDRCPVDTSVQQTPVSSEHQTGVQQTPVEPKPVSTGHSKTRLEKTINKNSISLARLNLNFETDSTDTLLKGIFTELPYDEIKAQLLEDADKGEVVLKTAKQYKALLQYRLDDYIRTKQVYKAKIQTKQPIRKELLPEWFDDESEPNTGVKQANEISDEEKAELEELLKSMRNK